MEKIINNTQTKTKTISKHFTINTVKDKEIIDHLENIDNVSSYIKKLILADIENQKISASNKRTEIRSEMNQYMGTKQFKNLLLEALKSKDIQDFLKEELEENFHKNLKKVDKILNR